jgi:hypothetical protein
MPIPPRVKWRSSDACATHDLNCMSATVRCCVGGDEARVLLILRRAERTSGHAAVVLVPNGGDADVRESNLHSYARDLEVPRSGWGDVVRDRMIASTTVTADFP